MGTINDLPDEVLEYILGLLFPYKDLASCKCVSRRWYYLVKNVTAQSEIHLIRGVEDFRMIWHTYSPSGLSNIERDGRIAARYSHSAVVHGDSMFIFGGGTFEATNFNDLWRFDLSSRKFVRPLSTGCYPPPKSCATFLSHRDKLLLFGGWRYNSSSWPQRECALYNQLHVYDVQRNKWTLISGGQSDQIDESTAGNGPPTLARHSATIVGDEMIVFGGIQNYSINMTYSNDVWRLDLNTYKWQKQKVAASPQPSPRYGQAQVQLNEHNILIVGGCGGPNNIFRDAWLLTRPPVTCGANKPWTWKQVTVKSSLKSSPSPTSHVWCNPACVVGDNLLVLGPTRASDFQMVKETNQTQQQGSQQQRAAAADVNRPPSPPAPFRRAPPPVVVNVPGEHHQMVREFNNRAEEERQRLDVEHENILMRMRRFRRRNVAEGGAGNATVGNNVNMVWGRRPGMRLAAFQDEANNNNNNHHQERVSPRLQEAHQILMRGAMRRMNEGAAVARQGNEEWNGVLRPPAAVVAKLPVDASKIRVNRSKLMALHVCDLSKALGDSCGGGEEAVITWKDPPANLGCFPGAPEKVILYSLVVGKGELVMFGGLVKEINSVDDVSKVSNGLHFLSVPKRVI